MTHVKCSIPKDICSIRDKGGNCTLGIACQKIVEECEGCDRIDHGYCRSYINPKAKWMTVRKCPLASHLKTQIKSNGKLRVGQQKQRGKNG